MHIWVAQISGRILSPVEFAASWTLQCAFGLHRSPVEFLAIIASHPFTVFHALPDVAEGSFRTLTLGPYTLPGMTLKVLFRTLMLGPYSIACRRADLVKTWSHWACNDERALKRGMGPGVRSIMNDKKILLFLRIAGSFDWHDLEIFNSLINGFCIVRDQKPCGIFCLEPRRAGITVGELEDMPKFVRPALLGKVHALQVDDDLWCHFQCCELQPCVKAYAESWV